MLRLTPRPGPLALALLLGTAAAFAQTPPPALPPPAPAAAPQPAPPASALPAATPAPPAAAAHKGPLPKLPPPPPPPDVPARLWMIAPGPREPWTLRIDNEGDRAIRIPADIRLLSFDIEVPVNDPKNPKKKPLTYKCAAPDGLRPTGFPDRRALLLAPGQSYIESFDPRLFCFGKNAAALVGTAIVHTRFGWAPPSKFAAASKKPPTGPFAAEGTDFPPILTPLRQLTAPTLVLSFGTPVPPPVPVNPPAPPANAASPDPAAPAASATPAATATPAAPPAAGTAAPSAPPDGTAAPAASSAPAAPAPPKIVDGMAPRLAVEVSTYNDASKPSSATVTVTARNAGGRPMVAVLRQRMLFFEVTGPDHIIACSASAPTHAYARESYRELAPGKSTSFTVLLNEVCPDDVFTRPGLYKVKAGVWANENGSEVGLDAYTGKASTEAPGFVRLITASDPFYSSAPRAVPTPKPEMSKDDGETNP